MQKLTVEEFEQEFGKVEEVIGTQEDVAFIYVSDHEECPYIGIEYTSGVVWVYGARVDHEVIDGDELEYYLNQEG